MAALSASPPVFAILSALVSSHAGLHYGLADQEVFIERVASRAVDAGFDSLLDYYYFLRYDPGGPAELAKLVDALVVNETFFFRELEPLRLVVSQFLVPRVREGRRPRVWSAACATGEEPLTLAMLLAEEGVLSKVDIVASDISARALERAKVGRFSRRSLRDPPDARLASRWIREAPGGGLTVPAELLNAIEWRQMNLCDPSSAASMAPCDVILCRNVLIYFGDDALVRVIGSLTGALTPDGALFVGISESLLRFGTLLTCEERNQVFFYRKGP
jgi:chemotaxis protein methyltransferase CheR